MLFLLGRAKCQCVYGFDEIYCLASGYEGNGLAVNLGYAVRAVIAVERQSEFGEVLIIEVHCQRYFFLTCGLFISELCGRDRLQCRSEVTDIELYTVICPSLLGILVVRFFIGDSVYKAVFVPVEAYVNGCSGIKISCEQLLMTQRIIGNCDESIIIILRNLIDNLRLADARITCNGGQVGFLVFYCLVVLFKLLRILREIES